MISQKHRFHGHGSLKFIYKNGNTQRSGVLIIKTTKNPYRKKYRASVVVSKKVLKSAVGRNRIRRRIYEIIRRKEDTFKNIDIVIIVVSSEVLTMAHSELDDMISNLLMQSPDYSKK